jgi:hypothetical protein
MATSTCDHSAPETRVLTAVCNHVLIAEGTFNVVHRARCKATGAIYALKKLKLNTFNTLPLPR